MSDEQPLNHYQHSLEPNVKSEINRNILGLQANACDVLRDLVPFVQFKKLGKHPSRSVTFTKVARF